MNAAADKARYLAADNEFENYVFGEDVTVEHFNGWESDGLHWNRRVFVKWDDAADSTVLQFAVKFNANGDVLEAIATNPHGEVVGHRPEQVRARVTIDVVYNAGGESPEALRAVLEHIGPHVTGNGMLSGQGEATVASHSFKVKMLSPEAASLTEERIADWIKDSIQSGKMDVDRLHLLMARYALADPAEMREEMAERMGLFEQAGDGDAEPQRERG